MQDLIENHKDKSGTSYYPIHNTLFDKRIWTIKDVSLFTGFTVKSLYNMKDLPRRKRGNRLFFIPEEIMDWIDTGGIT
jgi:hypothetical protein